jgi:phthalate 4,5-dioxygenase
MLRGELNALLTQTNPGTPAGELLRRYWQPVGLSREVVLGGRPEAVKVLGEDLVLFRDDQGRPGLLGLHCSHRLTSLAYGRVEDGGIRCPFHGWLYDVGGRCLEQPAEPEGSTFGGHVRHRAYPCQELGGLIFAYLGPPEQMPLLPRYEVLVREDGSRMTNYYTINSNYLQNVEGALDTVHFSYLHQDHWSTMKPRLASLPKPRIELQETDFGIWQRTVLPNAMRDTTSVVYAHFFMPAGFFRVEVRAAGRDRQWRLQSPAPQPARDGGGEAYVLKFQSWYVPIDDTHTKRFQAAFAPLDTHETPYPWPQEDDYLQPGPENDYFRDYERVDTISGIPVVAPGTGIKGFLVQDNMVNETQGAIVDRTQEHLGAHDHVLTRMRRILLSAIEDVAGGRDPKHVFREPPESGFVCIAGSDPVERV